MTRFLSRYWQWIIIIVFIAIYTITLSYFSIQRHNAFYSGFDLSNMDQTIWNSLHSRPFSLTGDDGTISRFTIHGDIILVLLSPLYLLWDNVRALLVFQSFALALGAIPVYLISFQLLKNKVLALLFVMIYLLNPGMQWTNMYDFHSISLVIPLLLALFYCALTKKWGWYFLFLILSLTTKEEVPLTTITLGILIFLLFKERKIGLTTIMISAVWLLVVMKIIIPHFTGEYGYYYSSWYQINEISGNTSLIDIPNELVRNYFIVPDAMSLYNILLREFAFLPLLGLPWLLLSMPELLINIFSSHAQMRSITLHYDSVIIPGLMISSIYAVYYIKCLLQKLRVNSLNSLGILLLISVTAVLIVGRVDYHYSPLPFTPSCWCKMYHVSKYSEEFDKTLAAIPVKASVTASPEVAPHISHRENAYTLPSAIGFADYIALSDQNRIPGDNSPKEFEPDLINTLKNNTSFELIYQGRHYYLYKRK